MKVKELKEDKTIKEWLSDIKAADNTKGSYLSSMQQFTEYTKKKPLQLLEEAEAEIKSGLLMRERKITTYLREFRESLETKRRAPLTIKNRMNAVCSFYKSYNIQLPVLPRNMSRAKPQPKRRDMPTKEDLQKILTHADLLERAIILTGISSGLSVNEIANLKVRDFTDGYDPQTSITTLRLVRQKTDYEFITFLSPEASKAVQDYMDYRGRKPKSNRITQLNQLKKQRIILDKDKKPAKHGYLFVSRIVSGKYLKTEKAFAKEEMRKLDRLSILAMYRRLNEDAQKSADHGEWNLIRSHTIRKWFYNQFRNNGADETKTEFMMGHQIEGSKAHYWISDPRDLKEMYRNLVPFITIEKSLDITESEDFKRIKSEHATLLAEAEMHRVERSELQEVRAELESEKKKHEAWKSELEKKLTDAFTLNEQKKIDFSRELIDEEICALEEDEDEYSRPIIEIPEGKSPLKGLSDYSPEVIPEEIPDIIERILNHKIKKE